MLSGFRVLGKVVCYHRRTSANKQVLRKLLDVSKQKIFTELEMSEILISRKKYPRDQENLLQ